MNLIKRLATLGYDYEKAKDLYSFYASNNKIEDLESFVSAKESIGGPQNGYEL